MTWKGWEGFVPPDAPAGTVAKGSKYHAQKAVVNGVTFDSKREARRYQELLLLRAGGDITELELQPAFDLCVWRPDHSDVRIVAQYVADFSYRAKDGAIVVEDAKGVRTDVYKLKRRWFEAQYGVEIREV